MERCVWNSQPARAPRNIGFWDALILASAARSGAVRLLSEDLNDGQTIADVRVENPFARC